MTTKIHERVKVHFLSLELGEHAVVPLRIKWQGQTYTVREIGMIYRIRDGRKVIHVVCVNVGNLDMRLHIDGDSLITTLVEVSDGLAD